MASEIIDYCNENKIKYIFLDFFGTVVKRNCAPDEVKYLWAKKLALELKYTVDEIKLLMLRKKSEQAVICRAENGEFNYSELIDEIYRRIIALDCLFGEKYSREDFYSLSHAAEVKAESESQSYIKESVDLINKAYSMGIHINIISDFYLGQEELTDFLSKEDLYKKIDNIFVSSDCRISKRLIGLYDYACKCVGISAKECIMVGDNPKSDIQNAETYGIKAFLLNTSEGESRKKTINKAIECVAKKNVSGKLGYSNYCFLLYLHIERLYKNLLHDGIKDIYFLSREGEFLKKLFDLYNSKRCGEKICSHYLYVSRKATYPATLKKLDEENFDVLRNFSELSVLDFFENIGIPDAAAKLKLKESEINKPIKEFFNSDVFYELRAREDFRNLYESSRIKYNELFKKYCGQEGLITGNTVAIADVGWNGTMQDNICKALGGLNCIGLYIGLINKSIFSSNSRKKGLIFSETPEDSCDLDLWKYDHVFLERILWASHGATDSYEAQENNIVFPVLKDYPSEAENYEFIKPIQDEILKKFDELDSLFLQSCYSAENFYKEFLDRHLRMLFIVNNQQLELQRKMIKGQMQNFGHILPAGNTIGNTFSKRRILKKVWSNLNLLKNTEIMFRILLNYNQKIVIKLMYCLHYMILKKVKSKYLF